MLFVETPVFSRVIAGILDDEELRSLQLTLLFRPTLGRLIPRAKGLRKLRWTTSRTGKRGGCRIIYYWHARSERCLFLFAYRKNVQSELTVAQLKVLVRTVREEYDE